MPPRIPKTSSAETLCYSVAGLSAFAPLCLIIPGAEERLAAQTARWAPRWERNITFFAPPLQRGIQRIEPPVAKMVKGLNDRLSLERMAKGIDGRIKSGIARFAS